MATVNEQNTKSDFLIIKELVGLCLAKWYWFAISAVAAVLLAFAYIEFTPDLYERKASVLIKEDSKSKSLGADVSGLSDIGLFQSSANVNNEIVAFRAQSLMEEVVGTLGLDVEYTVPGRFHDELIYGPSQQVEVWFEAESPAVGKRSEFVVDLLGGGGVRLSDFSADGEEFDGSHDVEGSLLDTLATPLGRMVVMPTAHYNGKWEQPVGVHRSNPVSVTHRYSRNLSVGLNSKETTIIDFSLRDISARRAEDILNTLISIYNANWVDDKTRIAVNTSHFINERLAIIEQELGSVDEDIAEFKSENLMPDVAAVSAMYMARSKEVDDQLQSLNNSMGAARFILSYVADNGRGNQLLPSSPGIESAAIERQVSEYNTVQLRRNDLVANSSEQNPLVVDMDFALVAMRQAIVTSVENHITTLDQQIESLQALARQTTSHISASPSQAKTLLTVERQQTVKEALYLFLLQKREENELSQTFTADNTRIVQSPIGDAAPVAPQKRNILLVALLLGLLVPAGVLYLRETLDTTVRGRRDMEGLSLPLVGEIPLFDNNKKGRLQPLRRRQTVRTEIVVVDGKRDMVNEAFRVLRTNLEFVAGQGGGANVIAVTSFNPGSGKSFLAGNIGASLALKGKRVLAVDGDMRHASLSKLVGSPSVGLSNLLNGSVDDLPGCIVGSDHKNLSVLPVGTIPPNPTELLESPRLAEILSRLRGLYDYILIDCPPVDIVADTQIIEQHADRTLFVVRTGLLDRSLLADLDRFYTDKRFKNMMAVLNATPGAGGRYGYRYGYNAPYYNNGGKV